MQVGYYPDPCKFIFTSCTISSHFSLSLVATFTSNGSIATPLNPNFLITLVYLKLCTDLKSTSKVTTNLSTQVMSRWFWSSEIAFRDNYASFSLSPYLATLSSPLSLDSTSMSSSPSSSSLSLAITNTWLALP